MAKALSHSDRLEVLGLLSKLTTTLDAIGKSTRDIKLMLKVKQDWPANVTGSLRDYLDLFQTTLSAADGLETRAIIELDMKGPAVAEPL